MRFVNQSKNLPGSKEILIKILTWAKKKKKVETESYLSLNSSPPLENNIP